MFHGSEVGVDVGVEVAVGLVCQSGVVDLDAVVFGWNIRESAVVTVDLKEKISQSLQIKIKQISGLQH